MARTTKQTVSERGRDRRNRRWRSLAGAVRLNVQVSAETKEKLRALANNGEFETGIGAVIEKLVAAAEKLLRE